jgi:hypothetical protein
MHPLLSHPRRLALYLAAWLPFAVPFCVLLYQGGAREWAAVIAVGIACAWAAAAVCLGAYYSCWSAPLATTALWRVVGLQAFAAVLSTLVWAILAVALLTAFESTIGPPGVARHVLATMPLLADVTFAAFLLSAALHYLWTSHTISIAARRRALELDVVAREAELKALRAQIDPHFLFNSLHSISALTTVDPPAARRMCVGLGDFLRSTLKLGQRAFIPLGDELGLIDAYLGIEQVRFGGRLTVEREIDDRARECVVPPLVLHPIVENAITHGIAHLVDGGQLTLRVDRVDRLRIPAPGARPDGGDAVIVAGEAPPAAGLARNDPGSWSQYVRIAIANSCDPDRPRNQGTGVGVANVRRRLETTYGHEASLAIREGDEVYEAEIILPFWVAAPEESARPAPALVGEERP